MGRIIGIDLGTTNSVAAYWKRRRPRIIENEYSTFTPSVIWIENGIERVGRDAKDRLETGSSNIIYSIKRFMGVDYEDPSAQEAINRSAYTLRRAENGEVEVLLDGGYYSPMQISAMILKQIKKDAEIKLGEEVTHAVITVPAYFGQRQKNATREAGRLAGLIVPRIIPEPTAAALAFGIEEEVDEPQDVLVYDLGGGTFDVSILSIIDNNFDVLNIDGDRFLGGDDFDNLLVQEMLDYIRHEYRVDLQDDPAAKMRLKSLAEKAKIELSRQEETRIIGDAIAQAGGRPVNLDMTITRDQFESLIGSLVEKSVDIVQRALEGAGIRPSDLDRVLLVGGSTRVPIIRQKLKEIFGDKIEIDVDPMQCVSLGAAVQTAFLPEDELQGSVEEQDLTPGAIASVEPASTTPVVLDKAEDLPAITMQDMISKFIGIETEGGEIVSVIPKGTLYPTHEVFRQIFQTNRSGQQVYELPIYESEVEDVSKEQWEWIGIVRNRKLPPGLPKSSDIMVEMSIDKDGILYVTSFLKNDPLRDDPEKGTLEKHSFNFGGKAETTRTKSDPAGDVSFHAFMFDVIAHSPGLNRYLEQQHIQQLEAYIEESKTVLETGDNAAIIEFRDRMIAYREQLPAPAEDMFFASLISTNKDVVTPVDRSQMQQEMTQMENSIARGDIDTANQHLHRLRGKIGEMLEKYPSDLLMKK
jgi:molecular chaperone DnaK